MNFGVRGADQLVTLSRTLNDAGRKGLSKSMRKRLSASTKPVVKEVREAVMATPGSGSGNNLRAAVARAVQSKVSSSSKSATVAIKVNGSRMPAGLQSIPALMEGIRPWRHPIYGSDTWVTQDSHPYFLKTVSAHLSDVRRQVAEVLNDVAKEIHN